MRDRAGGSGGRGGLPLTLSWQLKSNGYSWQNFQVKVTAPLVS